MLESFGATDPGCVRQNNEDYYLLEPDIGLYIVADGMGGAQAGEHASKMAAQLVSEKLHKAPVRDETTLLQAIQEANVAVMEAAARDSHLEGMGTTLVAALATPGRLNGRGGSDVWIASVGDSRAYLRDLDGLREVTDDQTWVNEVGRRLGLDEEKLKSHPMRHVLTMAVGVSQPLRVNAYTLQLTKGEELLLCSDGLHGVLTLDGIAKIVEDDSLTLETKVDRLILAARAEGGPDNITAVILRRS